MNVLMLCYVNFRIVGILRRKQHPVTAADKPLDGQFAVYRSDDDAIVTGGFRTIHHQKVAIVDARIDHGFTMRPQKKRGALIANQKSVQIKTAVKKVVGRRRKSGFDR